MTEKSDTLAVFALGVPLGELLAPKEKESTSNVPLGQWFDRPSTFTLMVVCCACNAVALNNSIAKAAMNKARFIRGSS
jgi:hypothetical protein